MANVQKEDPDITSKLINVMIAIKCLAVVEFVTTVMKSELIMAMKVKGIARN